MAVRPIDGNDFMRQLTLDTSKGHYGEFMDGSEVAYTSREIAKFVEDMPTLSPPNEPLTLEELRGMGGQPYWHVGLRKESRPPHWNILDPFYAKHIEDYRYGENWLAYRRPKEEE